MSKQSASMVYRLLEFLKWNTDRNHPATQARLRELAGPELSKRIMGDKGTFTRRLEELGDAYNRDLEGEVLPKSQWKIVYAGYNKPENSNAKNGKIYYNHEISEYEMDFLLKQIRETYCLTEEEKQSLEERLIQALCSRHYRPSENGKGALLRSIEEETFPGEDDAEIQEKLRTIREHILNRKMLELTVSVYDDDSNQENELQIRASPYRLLFKKGKFWMIGNWHERPQGDVPWSRYTDELTSIRVDRILTMETAHTPDETFIHWTMTKDLMPGRSYSRQSLANRETKARYNEEVLANLEKLDKKKDVRLEHMQDV